MSPNIKNDEAHRLARQLSDLTGDRMTKACRVIVDSSALVAVTEALARIAREAYRDFGCGSGHPARLSFGDCFAYALARERGEPLLVKGDDFVHTDATPAFRP